VTSVVTRSDFPPPVASERPVRTTSSFTALTRQVHELGLMRRRYGYYWTKLIGAAVVLAAWVLSFLVLGDTWWQLGSAAVLAVVVTQVAFLGHDAAHRQIFRSGRWNDWVSMVVANLFVGISYGWWQSKHTRHHANPNKDGYDPDIALAAVAMTPAMAARHRSAAGSRRASSRCAWVGSSRWSCWSCRCRRRRPSSVSSWACSGSTWAPPSPRTTSGCRWCRPGSSSTSCAGRC
jgi:fatty acid desaturase